MAAPSPPPLPPWLSAPAAAPAAAVAPPPAAWAAVAAAAAAAGGVGGSTAFAPPGAATAFPCVPPSCVGAAGGADARCASGSCLQASLPGLASAAASASVSAASNSSSSAGSGGAGASSPSVRVTRERDQWLEETWLRGRSLDAADQRNQNEITAAMQQWAMNRGRIEEEIMRRQESRRYVARSGRFYAANGSYQKVQSEASSMRDRATYGGAAAGGADGANGRGGGGGGGGGQAGRATAARPRTAKSAPRAKPIVSTPVVVLRRPVGDGANSGAAAQKKKKPPMHFKYGPRSTGANGGGSAKTSAAAAEMAAGAAEQKQADGASSDLTGYARPPRARPASAQAGSAVAASLSPYRGNYGHSMVSDSFGVRGSSVERGLGDGRPASPEETRTMAWDRDVEANDGEIAVLAEAGGADRVPPPPAKGSKEAIEAATLKRIQEIAFGAAVRRNESLRPPPEKTTSKGGKGKKKGKKKKKKKGGKKGDAKKGKKGAKGTKAGAGANKDDAASKDPVGRFIPRPAEQPFRARRPMSSQGRRTMREVESIKQAFTRRNMPLPCSASTLENALSMPEETPYSECVASLPLPGASFLSDPLAAERKALKALYAKGKKGGGGGGGGKKKKGKKKKSGKKKKK